MVISNYAIESLTMNPFKDTPHVPIYENPSLEVFRNEIMPAERPVVMKGLCADWDAVKKGGESPHALCAYLNSFATPENVGAFLGPADMKGRFFYSEDMIGRNFEPLFGPFDAVSKSILEFGTKPDAPYVYAGSVSLKKHFPGLEGNIPMPLIDPAYRPRTSLWIGSKTVVSAHWDEPLNIACVLSGRRRFTLFPVAQISNLYFGPYNNTIADRPISMVDFENPDFEAYPRFKTAVEAAEIADLGPGDALYMPSLWLHHVQSLENFGAMINFWWEELPIALLSPSDTIIHAIVSLKDRPFAEKQRWLTMFQHYIFNDGNPLEHLPENKRGVFRPVDASVMNAAKGVLVHSLTRR
jgi:hypothetical protein